jgi:hypothetical protein
MVNCQMMTDIEAVAAAIHETWRALSHRHGWSMQQHLDRPYAELADADKDDNRAAARRMGDVLGVAGLRLSNDPAAQPMPEGALESGIDTMAEAEHNGWMSQRLRNGWSWALARDDAAKQHPSIRPYHELSEKEKEKDRDSVRHYPEFAARAGYRITPKD